MNTQDTNQANELSSKDVYTLCLLATEAGIKLPTQFVDAIWARIFEDMQPWAEADFDASILFEVLNWQDRMKDQWQ